MDLKDITCRCAILFAMCLSVSVYLTFCVWSVDRHERESPGKGADKQTLEQTDEEFMKSSDKDLDSGKCTEKQNFVFIKCMKCATETMATVFRRFGYARNLSFVTPVKDKFYLGWPFLMTKYDYRPSSRGYNIIMEHSIYNKTIMENLMPKDTVYISIIREPFRHVKSSLNYWRIFEVADVKAYDPLSEYINNLEKYEAIYKRSEKHDIRHCVPDGFSMTKNLLSHCLGMPLGFPSGRADISRDQEAVQRYIQQLDGDFYLIMLVEYFHESLVLLKRKMCWTFIDIIYRSTNEGQYNFKDRESHMDLVNIYKNWSSIDYQLYEHFNKTFWKQIEGQSSDFFDEVAEFSRSQATVTQFCQSTASRLYINSSKWSPAFTIDGEYCQLQREHLLTRIKLRYDYDEKDLLERDEKGLLERDEKGLLEREPVASHPGPQALC